MRTRRSSGNQSRRTNQSSRAADTKRASSGKPYRRGGILLIGFDDERPRTVTEKVGDAWRAFTGEKKR